MKVEMHIDELFVGILAFGYNEWYHDLMIQRPFWAELLMSQLARKPVVWLAGVRRSGKTMLCQSLPGIRYFDCELPSVRRACDDPESFLKAQGPGTLVLDEVHRLDEPTQLLKLAADHFPETRIIATGSSTLGASARFRDTLTGRKAEVILYPLCSADTGFPGLADLSRRFLYGGLPGFYMAETRDDRDYSEWLESFWARDILELFRLERRSSFLKFSELLLAQSGGRFEASSFTSPCGVSRPTIMNYLSILEATLFVQVVRPYAAGAPSEIVATPVVYGFDIGFVAWAQGLHEVPDKDKGLLWEHLVLNELSARLQTREIRHWRDKRGREVDFVIPLRGRAPVAIETKWRADNFDPKGMLAMRAIHPGGLNLVVASDCGIPYVKTMAGLEFIFCSLQDLAERIRMYKASGQ